MINRKKNPLLFLLLFFSLPLWAQDPDLSIYSYEDPYDFQGDGQVANLITLGIDNNGAIPTLSGMQIDVSMTNSVMEFEGDFIFGGWTCTVTQQTHPQELGCFTSNNLNPGGDATLEIPVLAPPGTFNFNPAMSAVVIDVAGNESTADLGDNTVSFGVNYSGPLPDLTTSLAFSNGSQNPFDPVDSIYVDLTVTNNGEDATGVSGYLSGPHFNFNQNDPLNDTDCVFGQGVIECTTFLLSAGQSQTFTIAGLVDQAAQAGSYNLTGDASALEGDADPLNNDSTLSYTISGPAVPVIDVDKFVWDGTIPNSGSVTNLPQNGIAEYLVYLRNTGTADATNVTLTDALPAGVTFDATLNGGNNPEYFQAMGNGNCGFVNSTLTCNVPTVAAGSTQNLVKIFTRVTGNPGTVITNTAFSPFGAGVSADATFTINPAAPTIDLSATIDIPQPDYNVGDVIPITVDVENLTLGVNADFVRMEVNLLNEMEFQNLSADPIFLCGHDGSPSGGTIICQSNSNFLNGGNSATIDINVLAAQDTLTTLSVTGILSTSSFPDSNTGNNNPSDAVQIFGPSNDFIITKAVGNTNVLTGDSFDYHIQGGHNFTGGSDATDLTIQDVLPQELSYQGFTDQSTGATFSCTHTGENTGGTVVCDTGGAPFPILNSTVDILIHVEAVTAGTASNTATIASATDFDNSNNSSTATAVNITASAPALSFNLVQNPDPVDSGAQFDYQVTLDNTGNQDLSNLSVDLDLPTDISFVSATSSVGTCTENNDTVTCLMGLLTIAGSENITVTAQAPNTPDSNDSYDFHVYGQSPVLPTVETAAIPTHITPPPNLDYNISLNTSHSSSYPTARTDVDFVINNSGNVDLDPVSVQLNIDPAFSLTSVSSTDFNCQIVGQQLNCTNNNIITAGMNVGGTLTVRSGTTTGSFIHQMLAQANGINKTAQVSHSILNPPVNEPDVSLSKTASVSEVSLNQMFDYQFNVINLGQATASGIVLTDTLPDGITFDGYSGQDWQCQGAQTIQCQYSGNLAANASAPELSFNVTSPSVTGSITNVATVLATGDMNASNNTDSATVNVVGITQLNADISVTKTASVDEVTAGDDMSWEIKVMNHGPDAATQIHIQDDFPVGFVAETITQSNGLNCTLLTLSLTCEQSGLAVGSTAEVIISGRAEMSYQGDMMNMVSVSSADNDGNSSNNHAMSQLHVLPFQPKEADVAVEISSSQSQILQGDVFPLNINVKNTGPDEAENAVVTAQLTGLIKQINPVQVAPWQCSTGQASIQCHMPMPMAVGAAYDLSFEVHSEQIVQTAQAIQATAEVMSDTVDPNLGNNQSVLNTQVTPTPTEEEIHAHMQGVMGQMDEQTQRAIQNVSSYCARAFYWAMEEGMCARMWNSGHDDHDAMHDMMREITPNEVLGQSNSASEIITSQFANIDSRLAELRGGGGGFSVSGLRATYGNESIPIGMLAYLNAGEDDQTQNAVNDFVSPWGFFINGTISMGERDKTGRELGFDFDTFGITAGLDYRLSHNKVLGVALGYANFDSEIEDEAEMKSDGVTLTGYGSFYVNDNFYVDTRISYGQPKFEQSRRINFEFDDLTIDRVARGDTDADQYSASISVGYHFNKNAWNITPKASIDYVNTSINAFRETGAGGFNFEYAKQDIKSLKASLGLSLSRAFSLEKGVITPQFDINMTREMENDGGLIETRFINAPDDEIFWIETDEPDRTYGNAGLGLVFIGANGKQAYINYRSIFGLEGFSRGTINLGLRFEF